MTMWIFGTVSMGKEDSQTFNKELKNIKENSLDYENGLEKLDDLCSRFKSKYPNFIKHTSG